MWPFRKKPTEAKGKPLEGFTDWHCHLLPDVDDGVSTQEETLQILARYEELGVREVWLTPHVMEDMPNTPADLRRRFAELQAAYEGGIVLHLAAENMLDNLFEERLETGDLLPIGPQGKHLLVETSYYNPPMGMTDLLDRIRAKGFFPILAHPERYAYMDEKDYRRLKEKGIIFQLNLFSLAGAYGKGAQKKAEWLLKQGFYNIAGTDLHSLRQISIIPALSKSSILQTAKTATSHGVQ